MRSLLVDEGARTQVGQQRLEQRVVIVIEVAPPACAATTSTGRALLVERRDEALQLGVGLAAESAAALADVALRLHEVAPPHRRVAVASKRKHALVLLRRAVGIKVRVAAYEGRRGPRDQRGQHPASVVAVGG
eukprot:SAG11_NODE_8179_length_1051_cov_2.106092_1_plen_132_part_10